MKAKFKVDETVDWVGHGCGGVVKSVDQAGKVYRTMGRSFQSTEPHYVVTIGTTEVLIGESRLGKAN